LTSASADDKLRNAVGKTSLYVERLNNLIGELLDVSRIQSGSLELHKQPFDFDQMLSDAVDSIRQATKSHEIIVTGATGSQLDGDESHITQVITNLLSNAVKYSPDHKQVRLHAAVVGEYIKVSVTDKGVGISIDEHKKIFDRFYRVKNIQQHFPGMGIGLYVCAEIIKNHGGTLWVESEPGQGATFSFTLPLTNTEGAANAG